MRPPFTLPACSRFRQHINNNSGRKGLEAFPPFRKKSFPYDPQTWRNGKKNSANAKTDTLTES